MRYKESQEPELSNSPSNDEAAKFVQELVRWVGPGFHPDTDFNDYVIVDSGARSYQPAQAAALNAKLTRAIVALKESDADVYDIAAPVQHALLAPYFAGESGIR